MKSRRWHEYSVEMRGKEGRRWTFENSTYDEMRSTDCLREARLYSRANSGQTEEVLDEVDGDN